MSNDQLCKRCNYAYATVIDGNLPVCESCKKKIVSESPRICPVDQNIMDKLFVQNLVIDKCSKCKGIWLDGDEIGLINSVVTGEFKTGLKNQQNSGEGKFLNGFILGAILT